MISPKEREREFKDMVITIREVIDLFQNDNECSESRYIINTLNSIFFSKQTCLFIDGFDVARFNIDEASDPSYKSIKQAITGFLNDSGYDGELLDNYGFSKKRTLENLCNLGVNIPIEMLINAKSLNFDECDLIDDEHDNCLPHEYRILLESVKEKEARIAELKAQQGDELLKDMDARTRNNLVRLLLAINELKEPINLQKDYNKNDLAKINEKLDLLDCQPIKETAYKTLISTIRESMSKGL